MKDYYNTNRERGETLRASRQQARTQQEIILTFMRHNRGIHFTPFDIQRCVLPIAPITSIRRAMTNLAQAGKILKTSKMKDGDYRKRNHTWTYLSKAEQMTLF